MYLSLILLLSGESLFFKSWRVFGYASVFALMVHLFVILYEEPHMVKKWRPAYMQYAERVPRWVPRIGTLLPGPARESHHLPEHNPDWPKGDDLKPHRNISRHGS